MATRQTATLQAQHFRSETNQVLEEAVAYVGSIPTGPTLRDCRLKAGRANI